MITKTSYDCIIIISQWVSLVLLGRGEGGGFNLFCWGSIWPGFYPDMFHLVETGMTNPNSACIQMNMHKSWTSMFEFRWQKGERRGAEGGREDGERGPICLTSWPLWNRFVLLNLARGWIYPNEIDWICYQGPAAMVSIESLTRVKPPGVTV